MRAVKKGNGFTLIELLIVVAIGRQSVPYVQNLPAFGRTRVQLNVTSRIAITFAGRSVIDREERNSGWSSRVHCVLTPRQETSASG